MIAYISSDIAALLFIGAGVAGMLLVGIVGGILSQRWSRRKRGAR